MNCPRLTEAQHHGLVPWVYILRCSDDSFYVGSTWDIDARVWQHNEGIGSDYTRPRRPVTLVYGCETDSVREAYEWERRIHGWRRAKKLALIEGRIGDLPRLSRNRQPSENSDTGP